MKQAQITGIAANRRRADRASITIAVKQSTLQRTSLCLAGDISPDGILLQRCADDDFKPEAKCWLEFSLPGSNVSIPVRGQIVHHADREQYQFVGVRFRAIAPSHRRLIAQYIGVPPKATGFAH